MRQPKKLTGATITDERIRLLRDTAWEIYAEACRALGFYPLSSTNKTPPDIKREARYCCARIINEGLLK